MAQHHDFPTVVVGVDVGDTNTDIVAISEGTILGACKVPTMYGSDGWLQNAILSLLSNTADEIQGQTGQKCLFLERRFRSAYIKVQSVHVGTTLLVNAVGQRSKDLSKVAVLRLCGDASKSVPPFSGFPIDLKQIVAGPHYFLQGGYHYNGIEITSVNYNEIVEIGRELIRSQMQHVVISGVFSSLKADQEQQVNSILIENYPSLSITMSHQVGSVGLLPRENAAILNESMKSFAKRIDNLVTEIGDVLHCPVYFTQNNGTLISGELAKALPILTFSSGPTNSMRGAAFLSGVQDAVVVDVGGSTTDVGLLHHGLRRQRAVYSELAGVLTNFQMPDVLSCALGGSSLIHVEEHEGKKEVLVGPQSLGAAIVSSSLSFGGKHMTATDLANAAGVCHLGYKAKVVAKQIPAELSMAGLKVIHDTIRKAIENVKVNDDVIPVILVGGGSVLIDNKLLPQYDIIRPEEFGSVAGAVGAAISQVSGFIDTLYDLGSTTRQDAIADACHRAKSSAVTNGAKVETVQVVEVEDVPLTFLPGNVTRLKVLAVGDLDIKQDLTVINLTNITPAAPVKYSSAPIDIEENFPMVRPVEELPMPRSVNAEWEWVLSCWDIDCIAIGAGILGCGGGGDTVFGRLLVRRLIDDGKCVRVVLPSKFISYCDPGALVAPVRQMGAPTVLEELLMNTQEFVYSLQAASQADQLCQDGVVINELISYKNINASDLKAGFGDVKALCPCAIGGCNALMPLALGAVLGLPVLDCDGMGSAFPELQQSTFAMHGDVFPAALASFDGQIQICHTAASTKDMENLFRDTVCKMGCAASLTLCPVPVQRLIQTSILGSLTRTWSLGQAVLEARQLKKDPVQAIIDKELGKLLCKAKVQDVSRRIVDGFTRGVLKLEGLGIFQGHQYQIDFQNENLVFSEIFQEDYKVLATVPDLISIVDLDLAEPVGTDMTRFGLMVAVVLLPAPEQLTTEAALAVFGPRGLGMDMDYIRHNSLTPQVHSS